MDATYKIIKYSYPLIVLGCTDINRKFFPIAFMFTSHEQTVDYIHFLTSLKKIALNVLNYDFDPKYICTDASKSMFSAVKKVHTNCTAIMCYFHVRYNVRKRKHLVPADKWQGINSDIRKLHNSPCHGSFKLAWQTIEAKWKADKDLNQYYEYFKKQWINSRYCNWQIYNTPPGYSSGNGPIESYNNFIKTYFTNRFKSHLLPSLEIFQKLISFESSKIFNYSLSKAVTQKLEDLGRSVVKCLQSDNGVEFHYKHIDGSYCTSNVHKLYCSCYYFLDKALCKHLVAACILTRTPLPGLRDAKAFSIRNAKRKPKAAVNESSTFSLTDPLVVENNDTLNDTHEDSHDATQPEPIAVNQQGSNKRGRPRKITSALTFSPQQAETEKKKSNNYNLRNKNKKN
jgi:hypothetical protein